MTVTENYARFWWGKNKRIGSTNIVALKVPIPAFVEFTLDAFVTFTLPHFFDEKTLKELLVDYTPKNDILMWKHSNDPRNPFMSLMGKKDTTKTGVSVLAFDKVDRCCYGRYIPREVHIGSVKKNKYDFLWENHRKEGFLGSVWKR